jgi:hypothetical protein
VIRAQRRRARAPSQLADAFNEGDYSMATDSDFIFSAPASDAEEVCLKTTRTETAITIIFTAIAVLIVSTISVLMVMA